MYTNLSNLASSKKTVYSWDGQPWWACLALASLIQVVSPVARADGATGAVLSAQTQGVEGRVGHDYWTKPFWNRKYTYRLNFATKKILDVGPKENCDKVITPTYIAGKDSIFVEHSRSEEKGNLVLIGEFLYANNINAEAGNLPAPGKPYMLCVGTSAPTNSMIPEWEIRRVGGVDTGILVIPFKVRQGDLFSDSTIGPYFAFSGSVFTLLTTFGLSQVTVKASGETDVKTETGLTFALGAVWKLKKDWNIGLVVGADHLSGEAGQNFKFQNKPWWSFAIGYQFAQ